MFEDRQMFLGDGAVPGRNHENSAIVEPLVASIIFAVGDEDLFSRLDVPCGKFKTCPIERRRLDWIYNRESNDDVSKSLR